MKKDYNIPHFNGINYSNLNNYWEFIEKVNYNHIFKHSIFYNNDPTKPIESIIYIRYVNNITYGIVLNKSNNVHEK